ncbi:MAG TPA: tripartite tricarboxylate transporter TctB family protein [Verrucomicrobiae bacterium]|nr:tripartite tricarboxylate transporter TctB family protein [Verrucomicrobiae bacterium]
MKANLTLFFLLIFIVGAVIGWDWPNIAKIMPVYVAAIPGIILVLVQLYREVTGWQGRRGTAGGIDMDEVSDVQLDRQTELRRTLGYFAWFIGGALGIWLLGLVIALPLLVFLYTLIEGKEKWYIALIAAACAYALVWGLFEYMLETRWPPGILFD